MNFLRYLLTSLFVFALSCGNEEAPPPQGSLKCNNNDQFSLVNADITTDYESVGRLVIKEVDPDDPENYFIKICSGSALSENTFLTAFHCLPTNKTPSSIYYVDEAELNLEWTIEQQDELLTEDRRALQIIIDEQPDVKFNDNGDAVINTEAVHQDLAAIIFPDDTFHSFLPIGDRNPVSCEFVELVGYGDITIPATSENLVSVRRAGTNRLPLVPKNLSLPFGTILISGWKEENGSQNLTIASSGDSGGPLLVNGAITGILSIGGLINELSSDGQLNSFLSGNALNFYASLQTPNAARLLEKTVQAGGSFQVLELSVIPGAE